MKKTLLVPLACAITATCAFAQNQTMRPFEREHVKNEMLLKKANPAQSQSLLKSGDAKQRLDSIVDAGSSKWEFAFDDNGNLTMKAYYNWENNAWIGGSKYEYAYNNNGNQTSVADYIWNSENNTWVGNYKYEYAYDSNGYQTLEAHYCWADNAWFVYYKRESAYDNNGNITSQSSSNIHIWGGYKYEFVYNDDGSSTSAYYTLNIENNTWEIEKEDKYKSEVTADGYIYFIWDSENNTWKNYSKHEVAYDNNGKLILDIWYDWDSENNVWEKESYQSEYMYDSNGNKIWESIVNGESKNENTFDTNGNRILCVNSQWKNNTWEYLNKNEYAYDNNGNNTYMDYCTWDNENNVWINVAKREFTYDSKGNQTMEANYIWDKTKNMWVGAPYQLKSECTYDNNGNVILRVQYGWSSTDNAWTFSSKTEYKYDSKGNLTLSTSHDGAGLETGKSEYVYDSNGNLISMTSFYWSWYYNRQTGEYELRENRSYGSKYEYEYDLSVLMSDVLFDKEFWFKPINKLTKEKQYDWDWSTNSWKEVSNIVYYYSNTSTDIPEVSANIPKISTISIFPNPVSENFTIGGIEKNTFVTVVDINGKIVLQKFVLPDESVPVGHLARGVYFVNVNGERVKVVKQ